MSSTITNQQIPPSLHGPVVYRREDYVGALRHLVIFAVDLLVILLVVFPLSLLPAFFLHSLSAAFDSYSIVFPLLFTWLYLVVLKPSRVRSPGYWVTGTRIVTINGGKPSPVCMTLRLAYTLLWLIAAPIGFFFIDLLWTTVDDERSMLRDLLAETRLIRNKAKPIGRGRIVFSFYTAFGFTLLYTSVRNKVSTNNDLPLNATLSTATPTALVPQVGVDGPRREKTS